MDIAEKESSGKRRTLCSSNTNSQLAGMMSTVFIKRRRLTIFLNPEICGILTLVPSASNQSVSGCVRTYFLNPSAHSRQHGFHRPSTPSRPFQFLFIRASEKASFPFFPLHPNNYNTDAWVEYLDRVIIWKSFSRIPPQSTMIFPHFSKRYVLDVSGKPWLTIRSWSKWPSNLYHNQAFCLKQKERNTYQKISGRFLISSG